MIYLLSNVKCSRAIPDLKEEDELVFLNNAVNFELFKDSPCVKHLYCRTKDHTKDYFTRDEWKGKEIEIFDKFKVLNWKGQFPYPIGKEPTTGFWVYYELSGQGKELTLVNFLPNKDFTTFHWEGHDWEWEEMVYEMDDVKILDLR